MEYRISLNKRNAFAYDALMDHGLITIIITTRIMVDKIKTKTTDHSTFTSFQVIDLTIHIKTKPASAAVRFGSFIN